MDAARTTPAPGTATGGVRRGARRALTVGLLVPTVALAVATPALAAVTAVQGSASGLTVDLSGVVNASVGPAPQSTIPGTGGSDSDTLASLSVSGLGGVGALNTSTTGSTGNGGNVTSSASVADVNLVRSVIGSSVSLATADLVSSRCSAGESGTTGESTITNLRVLGQAVTATGSPNQTQTITLPVGTVIVHINEQITAGTPPNSSTTVNALRLEVNLLAGLASGSVLISQSVCGVTSDGTVVPAGAIGGVLLTGLVAIGFVGHQLSRRRRGRAALPA